MKMWSSGLVEVLSELVSCYVMFSSVSKSTMQTPSRFNLWFLILLKNFKNRPLLNLKQFLRGIRQIPKSHSVQFQSHYMSKHHA